MTYIDARDYACHVESLQDDLDHAEHVAALLVDVICEQDADLRAERTRALRLLRRLRVAEARLSAVLARNGGEG